MNLTEIASIYQSTYWELFGVLGEEVKLRVLAAKNDPNLDDVESDLFVARVIEQAEKKIEAKEEELKKVLNKS